MLNAAVGKALGLADKFVVKGQKRGMLLAGCQMEGVGEIKAGFMPLNCLINKSRVIDMYIWQTQESC